jgi:hypothetical protein
MKTAKMALRGMALGMALVLGACATTDDPNLTPAERKMREQAATFNQTVAEGAVVGCIAGTILGILASSNKNRGQNAAIGCAAGAAVGGATGYAVASQQESYANEEERLDGKIAEVKADNQRLAGLVDSSRQVIASDKATIENLDKQIAAGKITADKARTDIAKVDSNIKYLTQTVANLKKRQEEYQLARDQAAKTSPTSATAAMDAEIRTLSTQIASLEKDLDSLMARRKVSRVG